MTFDINAVATGMIFAGWPVLTVFIVFYAIRSPWTITTVSRAVMELTVGLWLLYALGAANSLYGQDWPFRGYIRALIYTVVTGSFVHLTVALLRVQRRDRLTLRDRSQQDSTTVSQPAPDDKTEVGA